MRLRTGGVTPPPSPPSPSSALVTDAGAVPAGVAHRAALPRDAGRPVRPGQDGPPQGRHQLWAEPRPYSGAVAEGHASLQPGAGAPVPEQRGPGRARAPEGAGDVAALVGARVRRLLTLVHVCEENHLLCKVSAEPERAGPRRAPLMTYPGTEGRLPETCSPWDTRSRSLPPCSDRPECSGTCDFHHGTRQYLENMRLITR